MTSQGNGQSIEYKVNISEWTKAVLKQLHLEEAKKGRERQFLEA